MGKSSTVRYLTFLIGVLTILPALAYSSAGSLEEEIDQLYKLPEERIDIGIASLKLAKEVQPDIDIASYSAMIDDMVKGAREITKGSTDPDYRIRALNTYLFMRLRIEYDLSDPQARKPQNRWLNGMLDTKRGSCVTMPLLYLAVAQRLGYPVYPVNIPLHTFLRYVDPRLKKQNIEATGGGGYVPNGEYIEVFRISKRAMDSGAYLRTMTYREFLGDLIAQNGVYWGMRGDYEKAARYLEKAINMNPRSADIHQMLGIIDLHLSRMANGALANDLMKQGHFFINMAQSMGVTEISPDEDYMGQQKKAQEKYRQEHKEEYQ